MKVFKQQGTSREWIWTEGDDGSLSIRAGCFKGTLPELVKRIGTAKAAQRYFLIREALQALSRKETVQLVGYGCGWGYGNGWGNGRGWGDGNGDGYGNGYGRGHGRGYGRGYGNGDGNGDGRGRGDGYGRGDGHGYGYGEGYVDGDDSDGITYSIALEG